MDLKIASWADDLEEEEDERPPAPVQAAGSQASSAARKPPPPSLLTRLGDLEHTLEIGPFPVGHSMPDVVDFMAPFRVRPACRAGTHMSGVNTLWHSGNENMPLQVSEIASHCPRYILAAFYTSQDCNECIRSKQVGGVAAWRLCCSIQGAEMVLLPSLAVHWNQCAHTACIQ